MQAKMPSQAQWQAQQAEVEQPPLPTGKQAQQQLLAQQAQARHAQAQQWQAQQWWAQQWWGQQWWAQHQHQLFLAQQKAEAPPSAEEAEAQPSAEEAEEQLDDSRIREYLNFCWESEQHAQRVEELRLVHDAQMLDLCQQDPALEV